MNPKTEKFRSRKPKPSKFHRLVKCKCGRPNCMFCGGDAKKCKICGGFNGSLPTECPGAQLSVMREAAIMQKTLDFKNGKWVAFKGELL